MKKKEMIRALKELPGVKLSRSNVYGRRYEEEVYLGELKTKRWQSALEIYPSKRALRAIGRVLSDPEAYLSDIPDYIADHSSVRPEYISCKIDGTLSLSFEIGSNIISLEYDRDGRFYEAFVR